MNKDEEYSKEAIALGNRLFELRKARKNKPTQKIVAELLGVSLKQYGRYELGQTRPTLKVIEDLAEYFGTTPEYIAYGISLPNDNNTIDSLKGFPLSKQRQIIKTLSSLIDQISSAN